MTSLQTILGLIFSLLLLARSAPLSEDGLELLNVTLPHHPYNTTDASTVSTQGYDPSFTWHDYSTAQVWMGKSKVAVGSMVGHELYKTVWTLLDKNCRATEKWGMCHHIPNAEFVSKCLVQWPSGKEDCTTGIWKIDAHWQSEKIRQALITTVAGTLEAVTLRPVTGPTNCYDMAGTKGCNVGDVVRVNFPESSSGEPNFMHVRLWNSKTGYGDWDCCEGDKRQKMDVVLDYLGNDIKNEFDGWKDKDFTRDSRCIIDGWKVCP